MSRLIDADLLLEELNSFSMRITGSANAMAITIMEETKKSIAKMIEEHPASYDVDKVVEQLKSARDKECNSSVPKIKMCDAIEIVKSRGIE